MKFWTIIALFVALNGCAQTYAQFSDLCDQFPDLTGCIQGEGIQKRKSAYMRFGKRSVVLPQGEVEEEESEPFREYEKRKSAYMRFGKRSAGVEAEEVVPEELVDGMEKRKSAYMRFGKRKSAYMRFGKRSGDLDEINMNKRKVAALRFG